MGSDADPVVRRFLAGSGSAYNDCEFETLPLARPFTKEIRYISYVYWLNGGSWRFMFKCWYAWRYPTSILSGSEGCQAYSSGLFVYIKTRPVYCEVISAFSRQLGQPIVCWVRGIRCLVRQDVPFCMTSVVNVRYGPSSLL
jgi:hypothetical protein